MIKGVTNKLTDVSFVGAVLVVSLVAQALVARNTFGIGKLVVGS